MQMEKQPEHGKGKTEQVRSSPPTPQTTESKLTKGFINNKQLNCTGILPQTSCQIVALFKRMYNTNT